MDADADCPGEKINLNQLYYVETDPFSVPIPRGTRQNSPPGARRLIRLQPLHVKR